MKRLLTYTTILLSLLLTSCYSHKELEHSGAADVTVRFDWAAYPDAAPKTMALMVFADASSPVLLSFASQWGGTTVLPSGVYQFIGFNDDTYDLIAYGDTWQDFQIYSQPTSLVAFAPMFARQRAAAIPRAPFTDDQEVIFEPDQVWTAVHDYRQLDVLENNVLTMTMEDAITRYSFTINNVENLRYVTDIAATISGMSGSWIPALHRGSDTECIIPFNLTSDGTSTLTGTVRTFGHCPNHVEGEDDGAEHEHSLVVYAQMMDGAKYYYTFDITEQLHEADPGGGGGGSETGGEIDITLDNVPLPKPLVNGSGIQPEVGGWTEVIVNIPM